MADPRIAVRVDPTQAKAGANEVSRALKQMAAQAGLTSGALGRMATAAGGSTLALGALGAAAGVAAIALGGALLAALGRVSKESINLAARADLVETKFDIVFGDKAEESREILGNFADEVGRSSFQLEEFAAKVQDTLVPLGVQRDLSADLSVAMVQAATDASLFNATQDPQAVHAFTRALVGEREALETYGISILEVDVSRRAFELGLARTSGELTKETKAIATTSLILDGMRDAQGFATDASFALEAQIRRLTSGVEEAKIEMGRELIPIVLAAIERLGGMEHIVDRVSLGFVFMTKVVKLVARELAPLIGVIRTLDQFVTGASFAVDVVGRLDKSTILLALAQQQGSQAMLEVSKAVQEEIAALAALEAQQDKATKSAQELFDEVLAKYKEGLRFGPAEFFESELRRIEKAELQVLGQLREGTAQFFFQREAIDLVGDAYVRLLEEKEESGAITGDEAIELLQLNERLLDARKALIDKAEAEREAADAARAHDDALADINARIQAEDIANQFRTAQSLRQFGFGLERARDVSFELSAGLADVAVGFKTLRQAGEDAFKSIIARATQAGTELFIINQLLRPLFVGGFGVTPDAFGAIFGVRAKGGVDEVIPFARGGIANAPTFFNTSQGPAVFGEAGTEAFLPVKKDPKTGEFGVRAQGGSGGTTINFSPTINVQAGADGRMAARNTARQVSRSLRQVVRGI